jgi:hypothetical protein
MQPSAANDDISVVGVDPRTECDKRLAGGSDIASGVEMRDAQRITAVRTGDQSSVRDGLVAGNDNAAAQRSGLKSHDLGRHMWLISDKESIIIS